MRQADWGIGRERRSMRVGVGVRRHPLSACFALTWAISWGGLLLLGAPCGMPARQGDITEAWPIVVVPYPMGPLVSVLDRLAGGSRHASTRSRSSPPLRSSS